MSPIGKEITLEEKLSFRDRLQAGQCLAERGFGKVPSDVTMQNPAPIPGIVVQVIRAPPPAAKGEETTGGKIQPLPVHVETKAQTQKPPSPDRADAAHNGSDPQPCA